MPVDYPEFDLADKEKINRVVHEVRPDCVINAAAYTAVDKAETESETARIINVDGVRVLAEAISSINGRLVHVSTDFVFDGRQGCPYESDDQCHPLGIYGLTENKGTGFMLLISKFFSR